MSRYIEVNEFYDKMYEWVRMHGGIIRNEMQAILEAVTSIDIVRCKECRRWATKHFEDGYGWCEHHINETTADDFCSYGERREP